MNEQPITLDLRKTGFGKRVVIRQNDYHGITLVVDVTDGSKAYSVPAAAKCFLMARMLGSYVRDGGCTVEGGRIVYTADERMFGASGTAEAYFRIEVDGAAYSTEGFQLVVERAADSYAQLSKTYDTEVDRAIKGADDAAAKADDAAEGAKAAGGGADAAAKKAGEAAAKAEAWAGEVDEATASATTAAENADAAAQQATAAANKVFPAADNVLIGSASGAVAHAEDAFEGAALRGITVEGACKQSSTTGANLFDIRKFVPNEYAYGLAVSVEDNYICVKGTVRDVGDIQTPSFNLGQYSDNSLSGRQLKLKVFDAPEYLAGVYGLRSTEETSIAATASFRDGIQIDWRLELAITEGELGEYEPYTGGKPSPSPDYPQPIAIIENPTVKVTGKNLWTFASSATSIEGHQSVFVEDKTPFTLFPGVYTFSAAGSLGNTDAPLFGYTATGERVTFFRILHNTSNPRYSFTVTEPITSIYFVANAANSNAGTISNIQLERNSTSTDYKPHTSQTLTFTLPAEHPYLAKLPDGTADAIEVDEAGNVELVARVGKVVPTKDNALFYSDPNGAPYVNVRFETARRDASLMCSSHVVSKWTTESGFVYCPSTSGLIVRDSRFTSLDVALKLLEDAVIYVEIQEKRYPLVPIDMPKAQDSIVNAWTDAEVTPSTSIRYIRDINIVVANIESAIASIS